uniref:Tetratricopeptide repeat protein n=1 Tax=candidate division WOR-3 bacterium TaxID=2052148 RepID=A0A7C4THM1_UNCW3
MESDLLEKSREFMKEGRYEKAQIILRRALEENPDRARVLELCGDLAVKLGRNDEAIARYEHASENYTHSGEYQEAIICLEKILKIEELKENVVFRLVDLYRFYGLPNEGVKKLLDLSSKALDKNNESLFIAGLRKIVELQPKNLQLGLSFAKLLYSIDRNREAEDELMRLKRLAQEIGDEGVLSEIRKFLPNFDGGEELDPKSRIELGNLLYEIGSKDEAIVEFSKAATDLLASNRIDEAISVLNKIIEIDPGNSEALKMLKEIKEGKQEEKPEEIVGVAKEPEVSKPSAEPPPVEIPLETLETSKIQSDIELLKELSREVEGFAPAAPQAPAEAAPKKVEPEKPQEVLPPIEGQIADIEFLLKESEVEAKPTFELAKQFDEFRANIAWESEDIKKKLELAKKTYGAELYETTLTLIKENRDDKTLWPTSIEIIGGSLIKLSRYSEAIKTIGPVILLEEIPEDKKLELRYLLAAAYEGVGDFENALREIEHILSINPQYRDVQEMYELLGGKIEFKKEERLVAEEEKVIPVVEEKITETPKAIVETVEEPRLPSEPVSKPLEEKYPPMSEEYPTIIEEPPIQEKPIPKEYPPKKSEFGEENITFI